MSDPRLARRVLPDGRIVEAWRYLFNSRVTVTEPQKDGISYEDAWCYATVAQAIEATLTWDGQGEPTGWIKHPTSGRFRPDGDPAREQVRR